ncbi:MAG: DUF2017 family protein [Thermoleophilia bacterium]|nr:DUF2017 family protein [Thermoleophilia bacterium]
MTALPDGGYAVELGDAEREVLRRLAEELRELLTADDPAVARLFPAAYRDDPAASAEYEGLVRDGLLGGRLDALTRLDATAGAKRLSHADVEAWCGVLNDLRLVLGERLGVTEDLYEEDIDPRDPRAPELAVYGWLTWLQGEVVEALSTRLE